MSITQFQPTSVLEAVEHIEQNLAESDCDYIKESGSASLHHGFGTGIRNGWRLWEKDSPLRKDAEASYQISHADDISGLILAWVEARVKGVIFDPVNYCERFHRHWKEYGMTSLEAGNL